jgi:alkylation response protein AidB-like acyl-CoA dehydrogenase
MDFELTDEQRMWRAAVHDFCEKEVRPQAAQMDAEARFNAEAVAKMPALGLLGLNIPPEYGGAGVDAVSGAIAIEELGRACGGTALSIAAHNGLGCAPIALFGDETQKNRWLPGLAAGELGLASLALTEPGGGSDLAGSVRTRAELQDGEWVINGAKAWITNPSVGSLVVTLCRTTAFGGQGAMSLIVVSSDSPGLHIHPAEKKMGTRASPTHALTYEDVHVPEDHLLGEAGRGLQQTLQILDGGRIGIAALSLGLARGAFEAANSYAGGREAFGAPIKEHQAIRFMLADAAMRIEAARLLVWQAAWMKDRGDRYTKQAAICKLFSTEEAEQVCRDAIQIMGAYGYSQEYPVERFYRDARLMTIGEGTSEVQRMVIGRRI